MDQLAARWRENAQLAETVADMWKASSERWKEASNAHSESADSWRRVALLGWLFAVINAACAGYWWI